MRISADKRDSFRFSSRRIWDKSLPPTIHSVSSSLLSSYANSLKGTKELRRRNFCFLSTVFGKDIALKTMIPLLDCLCENFDDCGE